MCSLDQNPDRASQVSSFATVGQNALASGSSSFNFTRVIISSWANQRQSYDYDSNTCAALGVCDFYTQVYTKKLSGSNYDAG